MNLSKAIPYDELHSTATQNEKEGYVSGKVESGDMFSVIVFAVIIIFIFVFILYKIIKSIYIRSTIDELNEKKK